MSKVKLTREQERALEVYKGYGEDLETFIEWKDTWSNTYEPLKKLTLDEMARLLYQEGSYEIEQVFEVGDWVVKEFEGITGDVIGKVEKIDESNYGVEQLHGLWSNFLKHKTIIVNEGNVRHATPEEIAEEKERRWWAKHGREVWELKQGDVIKGKSYGRLYAINKDLEDVYKATAIGHEMDVKIIKDKISENYKVFCFVENRLDEKDE